jgi:hypothetical protein
MTQPNFLFFLPAVMTLIMVSALQPCRYGMVRLCEPKRDTEQQKYW